MSIASMLLEKGNTLFCLSRKQNNELKNAAKDKGVSLYYFSCDLQKVEEVERVMEKIFSAIDFSAANGIYLINNAGMIDPIKKAGSSSAAELTSNVSINLLAPMLLTSFFIRNTAAISAKKIIVNISSGAANRPVFGWSSYCSTKAGLDMYTKTIALEQALEENPVQVISFSPGVMDTDMQVKIRSSNKDDFSDVEQFLAFHESGKLRKTDFVAGKLLDLLSSNSLESGKIYDIKQLC